MWERVCASADAETRRRDWPWWSGLRRPNFSPLPLNKLSRQFIRIDKKTLKQWKIPIDDNKWWISTLLDVYKKTRKGRIHQFAEWRHLSSPSVTKAHFEVDNYKPYDRPCLPGASFTTDGVSVHVCVVTLSSPHKNFEEVNQKGYNSIPSEKTKVELASLHGTTGVYKLESLRASKHPAATVAIGVDPGVINPVAWSRLNLTSWSPEQAAPETATTSLADSGYYSAEQLLRATKRTHAKNLELVRRHKNASYKASLESLSGTVSRTYNLNKMTEYAKARRQSDPCRVPELLSVFRSVNRRVRFRHIQRNISNMVHKILGEPSRRDRRTQRKKLGRESSKPPWYVFFFGRALFSRTRGHVVVPRKAVVRALACRGVVVLTNEYNTSKLCPLDYKPLYDVHQDDQSEQGQIQEQVRLRQCPTEHPASGNGVSFPCDRDIIGSTNILQKSLYELWGKPLEAFYPAKEEGEGVG